MGILWPATSSSTVPTSVFGRLRVCVPSRLHPRRTRRRRDLPGGPASPTSAWDAL